MTPVPKCLLDNIAVRFHRQYRAGTQVWQQIAARISFSCLLCVHQPIFCQKPLHHIRHSSQRTKSQCPNAIGTGYVSLLMELSALQPRLGLVTFINNQKYSIPVFCQRRNAKQTTPTFLIWTNDLFYGLMAILNNLSQHFTL